MKLKIVPNWVMHKIVHNGLSGVSVSMKRELYAKPLK